MSDPSIEKLLYLQECDARCDRIKDQLRRIPLEIEDYEKKIKKDEHSIDQKSSSIMDLEVRRREFDNEVAAAEEQIIRYKNQQLLVKKNEEYQALQNEIDTMSSKISDLEDEEIALMIEIDEARESAQLDEIERRQRIEEFRRHIDQRGEHRKEFEGELGEAEMAVKEAVKRLQDGESRIYHYVKKQTKRFPLVVRIVEHMCTGCHIKLPTDIEVATRKSKELTRCHNCGRILYD